MAFPLALGDILKTRIVTFMNDQLGEMVMHHRVASVGSPAATDADFCGMFDAAVAPLLKAIISSQTQYIGVGVQHIWPLPLIVETTTRANFGVGTNGAASNPTQVSGLIHWKTVKAGRAFRGRSYVPFPSGIYTAADGQPGGTYVADLGNLLGAMGSNYVVTTGGRLATVVSTLWHRVTHTYDDILSGAASGRYATQRRRGDMGRLNVVPF